MIPLTIALTILLSSLFSLDLIIYMVSGVVIHKGMAPAWWGPIVYCLVVYGPLLAIAWYVLRRLKIATFAAQLSRGILLAKIGLGIYAMHLALVFVGFILNSIPYGGRSAIGIGIGIFGMIPVIGRAFLFAGLAIALISELPAAERATIHAGRGSGT